MQNHASQGNQGLDKRLSRKIWVFFRNRSSSAPGIAPDPMNTMWRNFLGLPQFLCVACMFSLYAGNGTPDVNESHYLTKAKHFWDGSFASGDLFLESGNAHWFFYQTVGSITCWLEFPSAAWTGRVLGWLLLAMGWCRFASCFGKNSWYAGPLTAPIWISAMHWGHLSGEWVVGGCESKVFAYGFAFFGLAKVVSGQWKASWIWFGGSTAFHVLTGGWMTFAAFCIYAYSYRCNALAPAERPRNQCLPLAAGGALALLGVVPVLLLNRGVEAAILEKGYAIYVFQRLSHHLSPMHFASERWWHFGGLFAITSSLWGLARVSGLTPKCVASTQTASAHSRPLEIKTMRETDQAGRKEPVHPNRPVSPLSTLCMLTTIISLVAACGWLIDFGLSSWATNWSASLLRFYWFRWNDVLWPSLLAVTILSMVEGKTARITWQQLGLKAVSLGLLIIPGAILFATRVDERERTKLSPADRSTLVMRHETQAEQERVYLHWIETCYWIRSNTPKNALVLTPRFQQTFKWYAHRAEIVSWKDAPQDVLGLLEWERRMFEIFPRSPDGFGMEMSDEHIHAMYRKYHMNYVVLDRRIQKKPPLLPLVYSNASYAIFELSELSSVTDLVKQP
jgi:hypothetical protein